jgi:hypothetical protein
MLTIAADWQQRVPSATRTAVGVAMACLSCAAFAGCLWWNTIPSCPRRGFIISTVERCARVGSA